MDNKPKELTEGRQPEGRFHLYRLFRFGNAKRKSFDAIMRKPGLILYGNRLPKLQYVIYSYKRHYYLVFKAYGDENLFVYGVLRGLGVLITPMDAVPPGLFDKAELVKGLN